MASAGYVQISLIWVAYAVAIAVALIAATITTLTWQAPRERSAVVSFVAIVSLTALLATVEQGQKNAKQLARSAVDVDGYEKMLPRLRSEVHGGTWERLSDWDDHLENPEADWLENAAVA